MSEGVADELLAGNERFASDFAAAGLEAAPALGLAIVACMDARLDVAAALGLEPGAAHVIRNAGGVVSDDVVRSLAISQRKLGTTEIVLVHHTRCGMATITDEEFSAELEADAGVAPPFPIEAFDDVDGSVRESIVRLRNSPFIPRRDRIRGFVYDVDTGLLREVDPGPA